VKKKVIMQTSGTFAFSFVAFVFASLEFLFL